MAIYKVKAPDGRVISLKGDTPPTESDLDEIFSNLPAKENIESQVQANQQDDVMKALDQIANVGRQALPTQAMPAIAEDPKGASIKALQVAQLAGQLGTSAIPIPGAQYLSGVTTTPLTEFGIQKLKDKDTKEALKQAAITGAVDLAIPAVMKYGAIPAVKAFGKLASKATKASLKKIIPLTTGISEESTEIALNKPSIFNGKFNLEKDFNELGSKVQDAANYIQKKAGQAVGIERDALKNINKKFDFSNIANDIDELVASKQYGRETILPQPDLENITKFTNKIKSLSKKGMSAGELYAIRKQIDETLTFDINSVKKIGTEGEGILKQAREFINNRLGEISPKYATTAKKYSEVMKIQKEILPKLKDPTVATNIKNVFKKGLTTEEPVSFLNEFKDLDKLAPKKLKFAEKANQALVRQQFEEWIPKKGLLSAIRLAGATGLASYGAGTGNKNLVGAGLLLAGASSPRVYKNIIQAGAATSAGGRAITKAAENPVVKGLLKQSGTRLVDLMRLKDTEYKKSERRI